ncbi:MAG TPA: hypothetical protein VFM69_01265 [Pricia sp.]|nr:hypothetical protein [Pricia sp.]
MEVTKGSIKVKSSDGSETELGFVMPSEIASKIMISIMSWKEDWSATIKTVEAYQEKEKSFLEEIRENIKG